MKYYLLDKNDISEVKGIKTEKEIIQESGLTPKEFTKIVRSGTPYNGCILLKCDLEHRREPVTSETEELYQLIGESQKGLRYYVTSRLRIVSISPKMGKEHELKQTKVNEMYRVNVNFKSKRTYVNVFKEAYKAFIGNVEKMDSVVCDGALKIENLRLVKYSDMKSNSKKKKVRVGDTVYESIQECAEKNYFSKHYVYQMLEGIKPNKLGVELI